MTQAQMTQLFEVDRTGVTRHINNAIKEGEIEEKSNVHFLHIANSDKPVKCYSLDVIISIGYRVKSQRGVEFRKWANSVLKEYILKGYAVNNNRISQLNEVVRIMKRTDQMLDAKQVLSVVEQYTVALDMLDDYDHQRISKPKGNATTYVLTYEECKDVISRMKFTSDSQLFGNEKDDSFAGSIGTIYQTFDGQDVYPSVEEKAANLLYFVTKNHSFSDYHDIIRTKLDKPSKYKDLALIWSYFFIPEMVLKWAALLQFKTKFISRYPLNQNLRRCSR